MFRLHEVQLELDEVRSAMQVLTLPLPRPTPLWGANRRICP